MPRMDGKEAARHIKKSAGDDFINYTVGTKGRLVSVKGAAFYEGLWTNGLLASACEAWPDGAEAVGRRTPAHTARPRWTAGPLNVWWLLHSRCEIARRPV